MPGHASRNVDHRVEASSAKLAEVAVAVADDPLHLREELRVRPPAVEERELMPGRERRLDDVPAEKPGPAEDEDFQSSPRPLTVWA
jgi:hypothetical protein